VYFECVWLLYRRFFDCFSVICNKTFYKVYTLFSHTHLTTLSQLLAVGGVTEDLDTTGGRGLRVHDRLAVVIGAGSLVVEVAIRPSLVKRSSE